MQPRRQGYYTDALQKVLPLQAAQPIHFSTFTTGIFGESVFSGSEATICMAPVGQWRAQLPHSIPSVKGTQFS